MVKISLACSTPRACRGGSASCKGNPTAPSAESLELVSSLRIEGDGTWGSSRPQPPTSCAGHSTGSRIPAPARAAFRRRATDARCGEPAAVSAFAAVGVTGLMVATVKIFDTVTAALAELPEDARPGVEADLFGQALSGGRA